MCYVFYFASSSAEHFSVSLETFFAGSVCVAFGSFSFAALNAIQISSEYPVFFTQLKTGCFSRRLCPPGDTVNQSFLKIENDENDCIYNWMKVRRLFDAIVDNSQVARAKRAEGDKWGMTGEQSVISPLFTECVRFHAYTCERQYVENDTIIRWRAEQLLE